MQVWDTRECTAKSAASLKFSVSTPFSIRRIQWSSNQSDNFNQLAVQCERCIRVYDIRRAKPYISSTNDLEHTQRILSMDWTMQTDSVVSLSMDQSVRVFSSTGQILAESAPNETPSLTLSKVGVDASDTLYLSCSSTTDSINVRRQSFYRCLPRCYIVDLRIRRMAPGRRSSDETDERSRHSGHSISDRRFLYDNQFSSAEVLRQFTSVVTLVSFQRWRIPPFRSTRPVPHW